MSISISFLGKEFDGAKDPAPAAKDSSPKDGKHAENAKSLVSILRGRTADNDTAADDGDGEDVEDMDVDAVMSEARDSLNLYYFDYSQWPYDQEEDQDQLQGRGGGDEWIINKVRGRKGRGLVFLRARHASSGVGEFCCHRHQAKSSIQRGRTVVGGKEG